MLRSVVCCCALLATAACSVFTASEPDPGVLTVTESVYAPAETITARFTNRSDEKIGYGACSLHLERRSGSEWIDLTPQMACIDILYTLDPGETREFRFPLDASAAPGRYRLRKEILPGTSMPLRRIYSPVFTVQPRA